MARLTATAPIGTEALFTALASVMMSGITLNFWAANALPRRPKPLITSSKISTRPCLSQIARRRSR